uniref:DNA mismatch repair protein S5 domain-containing protein n=1 Tax=Globisporangium ultimum (strain ATCC 200006 / CBS 805.95 / DAOM BR144) TaxID=431595 RepID=K3X930_GLOUD
MVDSSNTGARIQRLSTEVVNRIAAGEVVHRPVNALKELLENSLDAGATQITVTVSQGGLKLLQIQDNGKGILRDDLEIVCERFTTSKLKTFDDLRAISSFGFRGEALASISHVAHVTITSKTASQSCAYKAFYRDGKLVAKRPGASPDPTPCAGKNGTQIVVEDLFYNLSTRKQALKNTSEQYQRILDVVQKYAIHYGAKHVGFVCKKHREASCDVNTIQVTTQLDALRNIYGSKLTAELLEFNHSKDAAAALSVLDAMTFQVHGFISNANYNLKKSHFILFINHRLVDCPSLKKACEYVYSLYLPKHTHPFLYLSLELPPRNIDVNVHPTKREVHFLHEEEIVDAISQAIEKRLKGSNESRTFSVQPISSIMGFAKPSTASTLTESSGQRRLKMTGDSDEEIDDEEEESKENDEISGEDENMKESQVTVSQPIELILSQKVTPNSKKYNPLHAPQRLVRTDHRSNTIDQYLFLESQRSQPDPSSQQTPPQQKRREHGNGDADDQEMSTDGDDEVDADDLSANKKRKLSSMLVVSSEEPAPEDSDSRRTSLETTQTPQMLSSVQNLLHHIERKTSKSLGRLFREHSFVGVVNKQHSLIQYRTKLYVVKHQDVAYHLFYEKVLQRFGDFRPIKLESPLSVYQLVIEALANPRNGYDEEDGPREQLAEEVKTLLASNGPMLGEYFSIDIDAQGMLRSLPRLLHDHEPSIHSLPEFVFQLATEVNWEEEEACFESIAQVLAHWYAELQYPMQAEKTALVLEHVLFPAVKKADFSPPHELNDASIITPVACLTKLYKIFERC